MAKELKVFQAAFKKLFLRSHGFTEGELAKVIKKVEDTFSNVFSSGERHLEESLAVARKNGVTGDKLQDFMKDKTFVDALKTYDIAYDLYIKEADALKAFGVAADKLADDIQTMYQEVEKDLSSRKDKSETKKDIETIKSDLEKMFGKIKPLKDAFQKLKPGARNYYGARDTVVGRILKGAPEAQQAMLESTMLPQMLVDRNRKKATAQQVKAFKEVSDICDKALEKSGDDLPGALKDLKAAGPILEKMKALAADYTKALEKNRQLVESGKDKEAVLKAVDTIQRGAEAAERKFRGLVTTMKKAG